MSRVHVRLVRVVHAELQRDAHVVLHAADLAVERDPLLTEGVRRRLVLEGVDDELLSQALAVAGLLSFFLCEMMGWIHAFCQ